MLEFVSLVYKDLIQLNRKQNRLPLPYTVNTWVHIYHRLHALSVWNLTVFVWILVTKINSHSLENAFLRREYKFCLYFLLVCIYVSCTFSSPKPPQLVEMVTLIEGVMVIMETGSFWRARPVSSE